MTLDWVSEHAHSSLSTTSIATDSGPQNCQTHCRVFVCLESLLQYSSSVCRLLFFLPVSFLLCQIKNARIMVTHLSKNIYLLGTACFPYVESNEKKKCDYPLLNNQQLYWYSLTVKLRDWVSRENNFTLKNAILFANAHLLAFHLIKSTNSKYESWYDNKLKKLIQAAYDLIPFLQKYIFLPKKHYLSFPKIMNKVWSGSNYLNHLDGNHI